MPHGSISGLQVFGNSSRGVRRHRARIRFPRVRNRHARQACTAQPQPPETLGFLSEKSKNESSVHFFDLVASVGKFINEFRKLGLA
jgi:hypothetical protein